MDPTVWLVVASVPALVAAWPQVVALLAVALLAVALPALALRYHHLIHHLSQALST